MQTNVAGIQVLLPVPGSAFQTATDPADPLCPPLLAPCRAIPVAGLVFTDVAEFARTIHVKQEESEAQQQAAQQEAGQQQAQQREAEAAAGPSSVKQEQKQEEDDYGLAAMDADEELAASGKPMSPRACFPSLQAPATPVLQQLVSQVSAGMNGLAAALPRLKPCLANTHPSACLLCLQMPLRQGTTCGRGGSLPQRGMARRQQRRCGRSFAPSSSGSRRRRPSSGGRKRRRRRRKAWPERRQSDLVRCWLLLLQPAAAFRLPSGCCQGNHHHLQVIL